MLKEGLFVDIDSLCLFVCGMSKCQFYSLFGMLYFGEGMWGVCEWNYLFNFCSMFGGDYFICQFMVIFDNKGIVQDSYWKLVVCVMVLQLLVLLLLLVLVVMFVELLWLLVDVLFVFDSVVFIVEGCCSIEGLLVQVCSVSQVQIIQVLGYIDCIGIDVYNFDFLQCWVQVVCDVLVQGGVLVVVIIVEGCGKVNLLV